jgi:dTDP-4-amino-4,6-dideoxygalactose transaminase
VSKLVRLARPALGADELAQVERVLASGQLTLGPVLAEYEAAVAAAAGTSFAVGCANGTAALHLAYLALGIGPGDEVVVPAYTFPATANAAVLCGARPVFCDVAPGTDVAGAEQLAAAITPRTRALCVVHLFGYPVDMEPVLALAQDRGLAVVEDAAGALGARTQGRPAGSSGDLACFSLHPRKLVTTGEGGAVATDDEALARRARRLRHHGMEDGDFPEIGLNYRLTDILAAIALPQLERLEAIVEARNAIAASYDRALAPLDGIEPAPAPSGAGDRHAYQAYIARARDRATRDRLIAGLRERGVESQIGTYLVPGIAAYLARGEVPERTPVALDAAERGLALPLYESLTADEQARVLDAVGEVLAGRAVGARA